MIVLIKTDEAFFWTKVERDGTVWLQVEPVPPLIRHWRKAKEGSKIQYLAHRALLEAIGPAQGGQQ